MALETVVQVTLASRVYTFRVERYLSVDFWRIESQGREWHTPIKVTGNETPDFFQEMAEAAALSVREPSDPSSQSVS
jgi:hypothetical protein